MSQRPRILLFDDSEITVEGLKSYLGQRYEVYTAYNGLDALNEFENKIEQLDLVITDLVMPVMSGIGVIYSIKQRSPQTPIIAMTVCGKDSGGLPTDTKSRLDADEAF